MSGGYIHFETVSRTQPSDSNIHNTIITQILHPLIVSVSYSWCSLCLCTAPSSLELYLFIIVYLPRPCGRNMTPVCATLHGPGARQFFEPMETTSDGTYTNPPTIKSTYEDGSLDRGKKVRSTLGLSFLCDPRQSCTALNMYRHRGRYPGKKHCLGFFSIVKIKLPQSKAVSCS